MVNQELLFKPAYKNLNHMKVVFCKTSSCRDIMLNIKKKTQGKFKVIYTKHTTHIFTKYNSKKNWNQYLNVSGGSPFKNTGSILNTWLKNPSFNYLNIVCSKNCYKTHIKTEVSGNFKNTISPFIPGMKSLTFKDRKKIIDDTVENLTVHKNFLSQEKLDMLLTKTGIHLCPSLTEGYGHYINESRSQGALIVSIDGSPMNELIKDGISGFLIKPSSSFIFNKLTGVKGYKFNREDLEVVVKKIDNLSDIQKEKIGQRAKQQFYQDTLFFKNKLKNFSIEYSLENEDTTKIEKSDIVKIQKNFRMIFFRLYHPIIFNFFTHDFGI